MLLKRNSKTVTKTAYNSSIGFGSIKQNSGRVPKIDTNILHPGYSKFVKLANVI